jgi:hypothetical protein
MRLLGDEYVKSEFRAHREVENPMHIVCVPLAPGSGHPRGNNGNKWEREAKFMRGAMKKLANQWIDWFLDGMATICAKAWRWWLDWWEDGSRQGGQNERYVIE